MKRTLLFAAVILMSILVYPQGGIFESKEIKKAYEKETRSRDGLPGKEYWQNTVHYNLKAELDPGDMMLYGSGNIRYTNNSPDSLRFVIIKLLANINKKGNARDYAFQPDAITEGMVLESLAINDELQDLDNRRMFREFGSNLYVIFKRSEKLAPGADINFQIVWNYEVVNHGLRNGAYTDSAFFIGYWYPQFAVYDDVYGWDREDYTGKQETYNEAGSYDVEISVPNDYIVWATGDQLNEKQIFSGHMLNLIEKSRGSDETIHILTGDSYKNDDIFSNKHTGTWKFTANNVPDFAWACSNYYNWDANSCKVDGADYECVWISAVYPEGAQSFDKVADAAHDGVDYMSNVFPGIPYPFNKHITFNGINYIGVEYPMIANNGAHLGKEMYNELTIHEIAHNYIPFYMLSNERKHAWIDEGWVKLIGEMHGESLGFEREDKEALNSIHVYEHLAGSSNDIPLIAPSGFMTTGHNFFHSYAKASIANYYLLELMKEKGVDNPLKEFLLAWQGKHPNPYDFFYFMNSLCNEDLAWYWNPWYFNFNAPDQELLMVKNASQVRVHNKGGIPLPVRLEIQYNDDKSIVIEKSIWSWSGTQQSILVDIPEFDNVKYITLGSSDIPDIDRGNNSLDFHSSLSD